MSTVETSLLVNEHSGSTEKSSGFVHQMARIVATTRGGLKLADSPPRVFSADERALFGIKVDPQRLKLSGRSGALYARRFARHLVNAAGNGARLGRWSR